MSVKKTPCSSAVMNGGIFQFTFEINGSIYSYLYCQYRGPLSISINGEIVARKTKKVQADNSKVEFEIQSSNLFNQLTCKLKIDDYHVAHQIVEYELQGASKVFRLSVFSAMAALLFIAILATEKFEIGYWLVTAAGLFVTAIYIVFDNSYQSKPRAINGCFEQLVEDESYKI